MAAYGGRRKNSGKRYQWKTAMSSGWGVNYVARKRSGGVKYGTRLAVDGGKKMYKGW